MRQRYLFRKLLNKPYTSRTGIRMRTHRKGRAVAGFCVGALVVATACGDGGPCAHAPVEDVQAMSTLLQGWAVANGLPRLRKDQWSATIEEDRARVTLRFPDGEITLRWQLDVMCRVVAATVDATPRTKQ